MAEGREYTGVDGRPGFVHREEITGIGISGDGQKFMESRAHTNLSEGDAREYIAESVGCDPSEVQVRFIDGDRSASKKGSWGFSNWAGCNWIPSGSKQEAEPQADPRYN